MLHVPWRSAHSLTRDRRVSCWVVSPIRVWHYSVTPPVLPRLLLAWELQLQEVEHATCLQALMDRVVLGVLSLDDLQGLGDVVADDEGLETLLQERKTHVLRWVAAGLSEVVHRLLHFSEDRWGLRARPQARRRLLDLTAHDSLDRQSKKVSSFRIFSNTTLFTLLPRLAKAMVATAVLQE